MECSEVFHGQSTHLSESSVSLTADGKNYLSQQRPGGLGGSDIYVFERSRRTMSPAVNLGPSIIQMDETVRLSTMMDILYTSVQRDTIPWGSRYFSLVMFVKWSTAENLGYPWTHGTRQHFSIHSTAMERVPTFLLRGWEFWRWGYYHIGLPKELRRERLVQWLLKWQSKYGYTVDFISIWIIKLDKKESPAEFFCRNPSEGKSNRIQIDGHTDSKGVEEPIRNYHRPGRGRKIVFWIDRVQPDNVTLTGWGSVTPAADIRGWKNRTALTEGRKWGLLLIKIVNRHPMDKSCSSLKEESAAKGSRWPGFWHTASAMTFQIISKPGINF